MVGVLLYILFLLIGFAYANMYFKDKDIFFQAWTGGLIGTLGLMWGIIPFAFVFGFSIAAHLILLAVFIGAYILLFYLKKKSINQIKTNIRYNKSEAPMTGLIFLCLILPISIIMWVLLTNHIMAPYEGGAVSTGQSTYGDLAMHMGIVTSVAERGVFPPSHNLLLGQRLGYPFLIDTLSSSLFLFGTPLRWAVLVPSYVCCLLLAMGFYYLSYKLVKRRSAAILATVLFFIGGGFGFAYFFEGAKADHTAFTKIFNDYYHTPTNYNEENIRWANPICDMIIPQRTTMAGWTYLTFTLWLLLDAWESKKRSAFIFLGVIAGCMPMIHTHSFMGLGIISVAAFVADMIMSKDKKNDFINWLCFGGITIAMALPQLFIWTFSQADSEGFVKFAPFWVNEQDPNFWFWIKNWGIAALFVVPAFLNTGKRNKIVMCGAALIFVIAELILFQPLPYDNNKLFFVSYMIFLIIISEYFLVLFDKLKGVKGRYFLAALVILAGTVSGALTIGREYHSGAMYQTFSKADIEYAEFVKDNTDKRGTFAAYYNHLNPTAVMAGRQMYFGGEMWMGSHGYGNLVSERKKVLNELYGSSDSEKLKSIARENNIDYVVLSNNELSNLKVNQSAFSGLDKIYDQGGIKLYKID